MSLRIRMEFRRLFLCLGISKLNCFVWKHFVEFDGDVCSGEHDSGRAGSDGDIFHHDSQARLRERRGTREGNLHGSFLWWIDVRSGVQTCRLLGFGGFVGTQR
jgi:hypothetical protein